MSSFLFSQAAALMTTCCLLLLLSLAAVKNCHGFTTTLTSPYIQSPTFHQQNSNNKLSLSNNNNNNNSYSSDNTNKDDEITPQQQQQSSLSPLSSDLRALLPKPASRPLKMDKFGRRIYRMEDDTTVRHTKGDYSSNNNTNNNEEEEEGSAPEKIVAGDRAPPTTTTVSTTTTTSSSNNGNNSSSNSNSSSSSLSNLLTDTKQLAGDKSLQTFENVVHHHQQQSSSSDLKKLLPTAKMRFMKLDKFGRRVQRMEDDGTTAIQGEDEATSPIGNLESESTIDLGTRQTSDSYVNQSGTSVNLKDLAGISKRPVFTKLDFKGGSVEDDRRMTSSSSSAVPPQVVEGAGQAASSSGLKGLALSSKRPIFTKLDFKGGSVVDERRAKKKAPSTTNTAEASSSSTTKSNLKDLLPTRPTFTKLDFKGGNVEDERRTKKQPDQDHSKLSSSGSLQSLLPERKFMWKKQERRSNTNDFIGSVGGDFIARTTTASKNDSVREAKQKAMRNEVIASATVATGALDEDEEDESGGVQEVESYSNLTDLLPQKKFVFRDTK
ncbi:hypothetical protein ACHAWT_005487 [Skeletonema menzelii]